MATTRTVTLTSKPVGRLKSGAQRRTPILELHGPLLTPWQPGEQLLATRTRTRLIIKRAPKIEST